LFITAVPINSLIAKLFVGGGGYVFYERRRAEVVNAGEREIVRKKDGEEKGSARRSVPWGCHYDTTLDIEVDPQRRRFGCRESNFALQ